MYVTPLPLVDTSSIFIGGKLENLIYLFIYFVCLFIYLLFIIT